MEFSFLEDEQFDFDLALSPEDQRNAEEDDDEIFFGPVGHIERCVATKAATTATKLLDEMEETQPLSPLNAEQVVEIFKEATSMAVMLKSSSDAYSDCEDQNRKKNFPELITDITKSEYQDENARKIPELEQTNKKDNDSDNDGDGFVVRRRALRERNPVNVGSDNNTKTQHIKTPTRSTNKKSTSRIAKSALTTPRRTSLATSKADRNQSSSASDSSFSEDKSGKIPVPSQSGLKAPGFRSGSRRRSSSNSSTSSTSSLPGFNLNETFTKSNEPSKASNIKKPSQKSKLTTKTALTKPVTSKPVFVRPSEVPKSSKLQPMKAVQMRSLSSTGIRSPARLKSNPRPVSAGSTPLRAQTPSTDKTPGTGTTPIRRRGSNVSNLNSIATRTRLNTSSSSVPGKVATPQQTKKCSTGIPGIAGRGMGVAAPRLLARQPNSALKGAFKKPDTKNMKTKPTTPENKRERSTNNTPDKSTAGTPDPKPKPSSRRRSLLPTPNAKKKESKATNTPSPVPIAYSPDVSRTIERAKEVIKKLSLDSESPKAEAPCTKRKIVTTQKQNVGDEQEGSPNAQLVSQEAKPDPVSPGALSAAVEGPDLMIQESPEVAKAPLVEVLTDPFSPGIDSPNFTTDGVLNPIVVSQDSKDLIDLSYKSPKPEVDLIDLDAKSPLIEAKLVDI